MAIIMNMLETKEDIEDYKTWLKTKSLRRLRGIRLIYELDSKSDNPRYVNLSLRFQLLDEEYKKRLH